MYFQSTHVIQEDIPAGFRVCDLTVFSDVNGWAIVPLLDIVHQLPHPAGHDVQPDRIGLHNGKEISHGLILYDAALYTARI